jgi:hypothetical protein
MSGPQPTPMPTPQPAPTPTPDVNNITLPNVPSNAYELLSSFADTIDTANGRFNTHATKLDNVSQETNGAVNNVVSTSSGLATQALSNTWTNTQTDFSRAHGALSGIIAPNCMGGSPNPLREALNKNKSAIQNGLIAMENIQALQRSCPLHPPSAQQVQEWIDQVNALTGALGNVNLALEMMILALRGLNGGFAASCATGFTPGAPLPTFPKNSFAMSSSGGGGGGLTAQQLADYLKGKGINGGLADDIALWADANHLNLDDVKSLIDAGADPNKVLSWLQDGKITPANLGDITTLVGKGVSNDVITQLLNNGANLSDIASNVTTLRNGGVRADLVNTWLKNGTNLNNAVAILRQGADLNLIGTSSQVGNFTGLAGKSVNDVLARIPADAKINEWISISGGATDGMKFQWTDASGNTWRLEMHSPDPGAPTGSNASSGWVMRVKRGKYYMDANGNFYKETIQNPGSPNYNPAAINATHIPIQAP